jgi:hypothetical protein
MKKVIIYLFILVFTQNGFSQTPWTLRDGYGKSLKEGFSVSFDENYIYSFYIPSDKVNPYEVERFIPFVKIDSNENEIHLDVHFFDLKKRKLIIVNLKNEKILQTLKIKKTKISYLGENGYRGIFKIKVKNGKETYFFLIDTYQRKLIKVTKHKDYSFTLVEYSETNTTFRSDD